MVSYKCFQKLLVASTQRPLRLLSQESGYVLSCQWDLAVLCVRYWCCSHARHKSEACVGSTCYQIPESCWGQTVARLESRQRTIVWSYKDEAQVAIQTLDIGNVRNTECLLWKAAGLEWIQTDRSHSPRTTEPEGWEYPTWPQMPDMELQALVSALLSFGLSLLCPFPFHLEWEYSPCAIVHQRYTTRFCVPQTPSLKDSLHLRRDHGLFNEFRTVKTLGTFVDGITLFNIIRCPQAFEDQG